MEQQTRNSNIRPAKQYELEACSAFLMVPVPADATIISLCCVIGTRKNDTNKNFNSLILFHFPFFLSFCGITNEATIFVMFMY